MAKDYGTTCRVQVIPQDELQAGAAKFCFRTAGNKVNTSAVIEYDDDVLLLRGLGFDGRCSFCRYFRLELKQHGILAKADCPFEVAAPGTGNNCQVQIGSRFFDQSYLEDEQNYKHYLDRTREYPQDREAFLALGVIDEYHGRFADAMSFYWKAYEIDNSDLFAKTRLTEILEFLIDLLPEG